MQTSQLMKISNNEYYRGKAVNILNRIGLMIKEIDLEVACLLGLQKPGGIYVVNTDQGKAATKGGLKENDIILEINDTNIISLLDIEKSLHSQIPSLPIRFLVRRYNSSRSLAYMAVWYD